jgi:hypothetical protein
MKLYNSFLLRCWVIREAGEPATPSLEKMVFDIEHIQKGEHRRAATPEEVLQWIVTTCQNTTSDVSEQVDEERK